MYFKPHLLCNDYDLDHTFINYINNKCEKLDSKAVHDLRNLLFGNPGQDGFDIVSLNIQRGRDHGLPYYNSTIQYLGLQKKNNFDDISNDKKHTNNMQKTYTDIDNVDIYAGGSRESKYNKCSMMGELFHTIVLDQFNTIRKGYRLWYENRFSQKQIEYINCTKLSTIIKRNTQLLYIPCNVFI
jgi:peroxidase